MRSKTRSEKARLQQLVLQKILPAERGESYYVAGRGRDSDAVLPQTHPCWRINEVAMKEQCRKLGESGFVSQEEFNLTNACAVSKEKFVSTEGVPQGP